MFGDLGLLNPKRVTQEFADELLKHIEYTVETVIMPDGVEVTRYKMLNEEVYLEMDTKNNKWRYYGNFSECWQLLVAIKKMFLNDREVIIIE